MEEEEEERTTLCRSHSVVNCLIEKYMSKFRFITSIELLFRLAGATLFPNYQVDMPELKQWACEPVWFVLLPELGVANISHQGLAVRR